MIWEAFLWVGFFCIGFFKYAIHVIKVRGKPYPPPPWRQYQVYKQRKKWRDQCLFPPNEEWFSPILSLFHNVRLFLSTGLTDKRIRKLFVEVCKLDENEWVQFWDRSICEPWGHAITHFGFFEFRGISSRFTLNDNARGMRGDLYVHVFDPAPPWTIEISDYQKEFPDEDWKLVYRENTFFNGDTKWIKTLQRIHKAMGRTKLKRMTSQASSKDTESQPLPTAQN